LFRGQIKENGSGNPRELEDWNGKFKKGILRKKNEREK
jgi:hypothetical protein